jgi:Flp pilus assembly protein TadG
MDTLLRRFARKQVGATAIIVAVSLLVLLGFAALAIDFGLVYTMQTKLQVSASAAALAGADQIVDKDADGEADNDDYRSGAVEFIYRNLSPAEHGSVVAATCGSYNPASGTATPGNECGDIKVGDWNPDTRTFTSWDDSGFDNATMQLDAVRVYAHRAESNGNPFGLYLAPLLGLNEVDIDVKAIAWSGGAGDEFCMTVLKPTGSKTLHAEGNADIEGQGCGICVNSDDPAGLWMNGTPRISLDDGTIELNATGFHQQGSGAVFPSPVTNAGSCTDPFEDMNPFASNFSDTSCAGSGSPRVIVASDFDEGGGTVTIDPGLHCGGIDIRASGHVVFAPGIHHIKNGALREVGTHTIAGTEVTFLIDNATVDIGGSQSITLSAGWNGSPFLFYESDDNPQPPDVHIFRGDANASYNGYVYMPGRRLKFVGSSSSVASSTVCLAVIADSIHLTGTTDMNLTSEGCGPGGELAVDSPVRLVD